jgi:hypothetical protein
MLTVKFHTNSIIFEMKKQKSNVNKTKSVDHHKVNKYVSFSQSSDLMIQIV